MVNSPECLSWKLNIQARDPQFRRRKSHPDQNLFTLKIFNMYNNIMQVKSRGATQAEPNNY